MPLTPQLLTVLADKVIIRGPKVDGGFSITFEAGEYEREKVAGLLLIPSDTPIKLTVEVQ
jgi:hypothetical protein